MMNKQTLLLDAHVHLYPQFNIENAIRAGMTNLNKLASKHRLPSGAIKMWLLTEGMDYNAFAKLSELDGFSVETKSPECLLITDSGSKDQLYVFAGRQIVTSDKLEICALITNNLIPDRQFNTRDTLNAVRESGTPAALNWAPGKWLFKRGKIVEQLLTETDPDNMLLSETTMRPTVWATPLLVKCAFKRGYRMLVGSDPLPFAGEEKLIGTYACYLQGEFDQENPARSLQSLLMDENVPVHRIGKRSGPFTFAKRQYNIMKYNRKQT